MDKSMLEASMLLTQRKMDILDGRIANRLNGGSSDLVSTCDDVIEQVQKLKGRMLEWTST